jgi:aspartate aminotransferase-like enzyme
MEEWGIDVVLTGSQKAIGVPPGLALLVVSSRAISIAMSRQSPPTTYFASFKKWLPIMQKYESRFDLFIQTTVLFCHSCCPIDFGIGSFAKPDFGARNGQTI